MKWKPSKKQARKFAIKMQEIDAYCLENNIHQSKSSDSYYFTINGEEYRVSNHTVAQSNRKAYNCFGEKVRERYHKDGEFDREHEITASKTRIIEIHQALLAGKKLDKRGNVIEKGQKMGYLPKEAYDPYSGLFLMEQV